MTNLKKNKDIEIDASSVIPIWHQLRTRLVYLISAGKFLPGEKLPTVRELAVDLGINYNTVSKVYQDIERDGYIVFKRGSGTYVADREFSSGSGSNAGQLEILTDDYIRQCNELGVPLSEVCNIVKARVNLKL